MRIYFIFKLFFILCISTVDAQIHNFNHFKVDNGLSNNAVLCSAQDNDGFLWFGTRDGLNRFDGYNFKQYYHNPNNPDELGSNFIHSLIVSHENLIWVGTDQGLYIFDPQKEKFSPIEEVRNGEVIEIEEDPKGNIWFISNNELFEYNVKKKKIRQVIKSKDHVVTSFCLDKNGNPWIGTRQSIKNLETGTSYQIPRDEQTLSSIEKMYVDSKNNIWIGTTKLGVFQWEKDSEQIKPLIKNSPTGAPLFIRDIMQVDENNFWIATESGLLEYNILTHQHQFIRREKDNPWSLSDNALYTISKDYQGGLWIGTYFGGINYFHPQHNFFEKIFPRTSINSIAGRAVREIVEDNNKNIWIGTEDAGLSLWNTHLNTFTNLDPSSGLSHTNIHGLAIVGDSLLVGTFYQGMDVINVKTRKIIDHFEVANIEGGLGSNFIFHIYRTKNGRVFLATSRGLSEYIPGTNKFILIRDVPVHIFYSSIYEDQEGNIWLSTWRDGVYCYNPNSKDVTIYVHHPNDQNSLNSNRGTRVIQDSKGHIWIATEGGLAQRKSKNTPLRKFTTKDGLPSNLILAMEEDDNQNLWITTTHGLVKMNINDYKIELFDKELGLPDLQFNYNSAFKDSRNNLYFGSSGGLIRFNPNSLNSIHDNSKQTPIYITGIQIHQQELFVGNSNIHLDKAVSYIDKIVLDHDESTISIDFAALNFVSAQSTSYLYKLEGFDKEWTHLRNNRKAYFTKIPPGKYTFIVKAADANGNPTSQERTLKITINPPFWASIYAILLYILLGASLIFYIIKHYDNKIKEKNRRRIEAIKNHKERELYRTKMDFFSTVAHDIKTPLTLIKAPLEKVMSKISGDSKVDQLLKTMHNNTEKLVGLTDKLLDFRKIESNEFVLRLEKHSINKLIAEHLLEFKHLAESKNLQLSYRCNQSIEAFIDIETISKIIDNLLSNAIKYAESKIIVTLSTKDGTNEFRLAIKNDGLILSKKDAVDLFQPFQRAREHYQIAGSGLGLALAHSFATLHGGTLQFVENSENLNIFVLTIPIDNP